MTFDLTDPITINGNAIELTHNALGFYEIKLRDRKAALMTLIQSGTTSGADRIAAVEALVTLTSLHQTMQHATDALDMLITGLANAHDAHLVESFQK